ncbi:MAG: hypothetical protein NTY19_46335 [Planctomycetota bacterium]|nr:hypothetical protein [Planctomycetota bacterium]
MRTLFLAIGVLVAGVALGTDDEKKEGKTVVYNAAELMKGYSEEYEQAKALVKIAKDTYQTYDIRKFKHNKIEGKQLAIEGKVTNKSHTLIQGYSITVDGIHCKFKKPDAIDKKIYEGLENGQTVVMRGTGRSNQSVMVLSDCEFFEKDKLAKETGKTK